MIALCALCALWLIVFMHLKIAVNLEAVPTGQVRNGELPAGVNRRQSRMREIRTSDSAMVHSVLGLKQPITWALLLSK